MSPGTSAQRQSQSARLDYKLGCRMLSSGRISWFITVTFCICRFIITAAGLCTGISNYSPADYEELMESASIPPPFDAE